MTDVANARLLIHPPNEMISNSDYILVGTVTEKNYSENHRKVKISIESSLKYLVPGTILIIKKFSFKTFVLKTKLIKLVCCTRIALIMQPIQ